MIITNLQDYITESGFFKTFRVDDLLIVEYQCLIESDRSDIWTHHNYFAYVLGGRKKWMTKDGECLLSSGEAIFVRKGVQTVYQYFEEPFLVIFIFLPDHYIRQILTKYPKLIKGFASTSADGRTLLPLNLNEVLISFFRSLLSHFTQPKPPPAALLKIKVEELILNILSQPKNERLKQCLVRMAAVQKVDLEQIMRMHYNRPLSIHDYARLSARSLSTFRRDFKTIFRTTPAKWLMQERLAYSRFLLETSDKNIYEVMAESGFKNRAHFTKLFKDSFGLPPRQYRVRQEKGA